MDKSARLRFLFTKYLQRQCSPDEVEELIVLLQQRDADEAITEEMELLWEEARKDKTRHDVDWDKIYFSAINKAERADMVINQAISVSRSHFYLIAFVFLFIIASLIYWFIYHDDQQSNHEFSDTLTYPGKSYYFDNSGNDSANGSKSNSLRTIDKLNSIQLHPGDTVYFESRQTFNGNILIDSG